MSDALKPQLHGRDHRAGGRDPIPGLGGKQPWIVVYNGATTIPDSTWFPVPYSNIIFDPTLVDPSGSGDIFRWNVTDSGDTGNDRFQVAINEKGIYQVDVLVNMDQVGTDGTNDHGVAALDMRGGSNFFGINSGQIVSATISSYWRMAEDWDKSTVESDFEMYELSGYMEMHRTIIHPEDSLRCFDLYARQTTGVNRGLSGMFWQIVRLGDVNDYNGWSFLDTSDF